MVIVAIVIVGMFVTKYGRGNSLSKFTTFMAVLVIVSEIAKSGVLSDTS
jgi:hypothetical protein